MRDLIETCNHLGADPAQFRASLCPWCRNPECSAAGWGKDPFAVRVQGQPDRLFNPTLADPSSSRYAHLIVFEDAPEAAGRLDEARQRQDWSAPAPLPRAGNLPEPAGGVMLDGSAPSLAPAPAADPWAAPPAKPVVVSMGASIRMGGSK